jgi:hypothetical protein
MLRAIAFGLVGYLIGTVIIRVETPYENGLTATDPANIVRTKVWDTSPIDEWAFDSTQPPLPSPIGATVTASNGNGVSAVDAAPVGPVVEAAP